MGTGRGKLLLCLLAAAVLPPAMKGFSNGPPVLRTGAAVDGGITCTACHTTFAPANSDPRGRLELQTGPYAPGVKQVIRVMIQHPEAMRWGFQLTARLASDETKQAGTFTGGPDYRVRCAPTGANGPCNGALEFISHFRDATVDSTLPGTTGGRTWEVEWTPPATEVGPVVFYAAGNAANNSNSNAGDRVYTTSLRIAAACALTGRPSISASGVVNAASFATNIAPNAMISIFGTNLAAAGTVRAAQPFDFDENRFPRELACVAVEVAGRRAPVTFVSPTQINAQVPTLTAVGPVKVEVILNPDRTSELRGELNGVLLQNFSPAFFTFNGRAIAALHTNFDIVGDPAVIRAERPVRPARPGDTVLLFGTGFGFSEPVWQAGELSSGLPRLTGQFTVSIGGVALRADDVIYAGLTPGSISGLYQFNVRVPANAADGDLAVVIRVGSLETQAGATILVRR